MKYSLSEAKKDPRQDAGGGWGLRGFKNERDYGYEYQQQSYE